MAQRDLTKWGATYLVAQSCSFLLLEWLIFGRRDVNVIELVRVSGFLFSEVAVQASVIVIKLAFGQVDIAALVSV